MKRMNELYNELKTVKDDIDYMDAHDTPEDIDGVTEAQYSVIRTMADIIDDLIEIVDYLPTVSCTHVFNSRDLALLRRILHESDEFCQSKHPEDVKRLIDIVDNLWYIKTH